MRSFVMGEAACQRRVRSKSVRVQVTLRLLFKPVGASVFDIGMMGIVCHDLLWESTNA
jgi:hypothetical protein